MTGALASLRQGAVDLLNSRGIQAVTAFEPDGRKRWSGPVAAVALAKVVCAPGGFKDYLGTRYDEETGDEEEWYGRAADLTLSLDIYGPRDGGESACRDVLDEMAELLTGQGLNGLTVLELESGQMEFLDSCGMYRLPVQCRCQAWLAAAVRPDGEFTDFRVKGRKV